jgi:N-acetyl sugar amidotransferase
VKRCLRCLRCVMPDTRPDTPFIDGVCSACTTFGRRADVDWQERMRLLLELLDRHGGRCIVPSSGGKDSTYQVLRLLELGADVTVVTATTCHLTPTGRANIDNLARYARTIEVTPNRAVRARLNRLSLETVGDISWPEHVSIFTTPFRMAVDLGIPLIFYGENPQAEYGGPPGSDEARQMTRRWVSEFGGFLGLRPVDMTVMVGERAMRDYLPPSDGDIRDIGVEAHFLGHYEPWDSERNAKVATDHGFRFKRPSPANWWQHENQDNAQTGLHDHFMWLKYGFGRGCQQISVDVRHGRVSREEALQWVEACDGIFPDDYAGVSLGAVLDRIDIDLEDLDRIVGQFTNRDIHG